MAKDSLVAMCKTHEDCRVFPDNKIPGSSFPLYISQVEQWHKLKQLPAYQPPDHYLLQIYSNLFPKHPPCLTTSDSR